VKICILTSGHDIFDNRIYYKEILSLKKEYSDIYLIAPGNKDFITEDGIKVKTFQGRKSWHDRLGPMSRMYKLALEVNADVYHAHEPDSFQIAVKLKKKLGCKIIYDSHEYHPEGFAEHFRFGKNIITKLIYEYEKKNAKKADYIISVNDILVNKFKSYNEQVELIPNYPVIDKSYIKKLNSTPTFIYVGGLREDRGILKIIQAIKKVNRPYKYYFVGPFETNEFEAKVKELCKNNISDGEIVFTGKIPHKDVFEYLSTAHVGFVLLQPENWRYINSEPIKLFEYMMTETTIIASDFPMMKNIINEGKSGVVVDPTDVNKIVNVIVKLGNELDSTIDMGKNGFNIVKKKYNWSVCEERLLNIYRKLSKQ
jgi:glycosyltransferase involved in cell wall biosynthesis